MQDNEEDAQYSFGPIKHVQRIPTGSETVGMQPYSQHVDAPPGKGNNNATHYIAEVEQPGRQPSGFPDMQYGQLPQCNHQRSVFLGIPAPEPPPGFIAPNPPKNRPHQRKHQGKTQDAVSHAVQGLFRFSTDQAQGGKPAGIYGRAPPPAARPHTPAQW